MLAFDEETHTYTWDGVEVPSVTQVLSPYSGLEFVDQDHLEALARFGRHVHEAVHLHTQGSLEMDALDDHVRQYLDGWLKFLDDTGYVPTRSEARVYHPDIGYAGTLDSFGVIERKGVVTRALIDIKTSLAPPRTVGPQTAAYVEAYKKTYPNETGRIYRYCCLLRPGSYALCTLSDPMDLNVFLAALTMHRFIRR